MFLNEAMPGPPMYAVRVPLREAAEASAVLGSEPASEELQAVLFCHPRFTKGPTHP